MASVTRRSWSREWPGATVPRSWSANATSPARSPRRVATAVSIITASRAWSSLGTPATWPAIRRPVSSSMSTVWFRSARYVRTMTLAVRAVADQSMRRVSSSTPYSRSESNSVPPPLARAERRPTSRMRARSMRSSASARDRNGG